MPSDDLNEAIHLIQQGQGEQAQPILQALIRANVQDLTAWSWYAKSWKTTQDRIKALELCLKYNPGNSQVLGALETLRAKQQPAVTPPAAPRPVTPQPSDDNAQASYVDEQPSYDSGSQAYTRMSNEEIDRQVLADVQQEREEKERSGRPYAWYEVWLTALTKPNAEAYADLLRDPLASPGRVYLWIFLTYMIGMLISFLNPAVTTMLSQIGQTQSRGNMVVMGIVLLLIPIFAGMSILGLMLGAAIYNLIAHLFAGSGTFSRTVYALGAFTAPMSILTSALVLVPFVNCLTLPLGLYSLWLNVVAIRASQRLTTGAAFAVVLMPTILVFIVGCIIFLAGGQALLQALPKSTY